MTSTTYHHRDIFFWLKRPTIVEMRAVLEWANKHALRTDISSRDVQQFSRRETADKQFEEIIPRINRSAKPYFRIILRTNQNWYLLLTDEKHIEDLIEIAIGGIEIDFKEYFIRCFLKKELLERLKGKFQLVEAICQPG